MEVLYKKSKELSNDELEALYALYYSNIEGYAEIYKNRQKIKTTEYKDNWINSVRENDDLVCVVCVIDGCLIGFVLLVFLEDENYISEFQIAKQYQNDGKTFKLLVKSTFKIAEINKKFTGRIWYENNEAKSVFRRLGAVLEDRKYVATYDKIKKWVEKNNE